MRKLIIISAGSFIFFSALFSQEFSLKYGKVTNDELNMKVYQKDTTAAAVVLYDDGYSAYSYFSSTGFQINQEIKRKIKVLKQEGVNEANISIPYYFKSSGNRETVNNIEAYSYNIENGKVVKTKLEKKYVFDEEMSKNYRQIKFSIPNVKIGSVIEYKYIISTNKVYDLPDWTIQGHIPVIHSFYEVKIPEYFFFNIDTKGYENVEVVETSEIQQLNLGSNGNMGNDLITYTCRDIKYTARDIPAMKDESNVWCVNDYISEVRFELKGTKYPNDFYKPYSITWEDLEKTLDTETDFTTNLKCYNPFRNEIKSLIINDTTEISKIQDVYLFVKNKIQWNGNYDFMGNNVNSAIKNGTGNNAQINILLINALKDAGIKAYPILMSRRSRGRLPLTFPSLNKLNTFIVAAETSDGKTYYMDGSAIYGGLNLLPTELLVDRARVFNESKTEKWVNLSNLTKSQHISSVIASIEKDGTLHGALNSLYINQLAYAYKKSISSEKDSTKFIENFQNTNQITVDSLVVEGKNRLSNMVKEHMYFTKKFEFTGDYLYVNPMIFCHLTKNDFTQSERKLPIEFNFPYVVQISCSLTIPENYKVEELPKSVKIVLDENKGKCLYQVKQDGNTLLVNYRFELNQILYPQTDYQGIKDFFGQVVTKNGEMVVLKKI